jgi:CBS domain containing-hemolysin-like protein
MGEILAIIFLLGLSFLFSSSEVAYFSLTPLHIESLERKRTRNFLLKLYSTPYRLLSTILLCNTAVNSFASAIFAAFMVDIYRRFNIKEGLGTFLDVMIFTLILLVFCEITPKLIALENPLILARRSVGFLYPFYLILSPITIPLSKVLRRIAEGLRIEAVKSGLYEEIEYMIEKAEEERAINKEEAEFFYESVDFLKKVARDVMTPRKDVKALEKTATLDEAFDLFMKTRHSRFPIYEGNLDHILGVVDIPHLVRRGEKPSKKPVSSFLNPVLFVPETMRLPDLVRKLRRAHISFAVVVDEYGGTSGIITRWDIAKSFTGPLKEEAETEETITVKTIGKDTYLLLGEMPVDEVEELLGIDIREGGTLAGFLIEILGRIPEEGESVEYRGYKFEILSKEGEKIEKIKVEKGLKE